MSTKKNLTLTIHIRCSRRRTEFIFKTNENKFPISIQHLNEKIDPNYIKKIKFITTGLINLNYLDPSEVTSTLFYLSQIRHLKSLELS
jgi:hypothetical protein